MVVFFPPKEKPEIQKRSNIFRVRNTEKLSSEEMKGHFYERIRGIFRRECKGSQCRQLL